MRRLFPEVAKVFDNPKPVDLLSRLVSFTTGKADVVLDLFAGACPLAEAVVALNHADGGGRSFIAIQLPEPVDESTAAGEGALELGMRTVADIGKERIRRVLARAAQEGSALGFEKHDESPADLGVRVFKLTQSHYRNWAGVEEKDEGALLERMEEFADPLLPGWKPENVIWEVAIKEGFGLSSQIERLGDVDGNAVYLVSDPDRDQSFRICLDDTLGEETVKALSLDKEDLFVCRDIALTDDLAANLALQCRLKTI